MGAPPVPSRLRGRVDPLGHARSRGEWETEWVLGRGFKDTWRGTAQGTCVRPPATSGPGPLLCAQSLEHRALQTPKCTQGPGRLSQGLPRSHSGSTPASVLQACSWLHFSPLFLPCFLRWESPVLICFEKQNSTFVFKNETLTIQAALLAEATARRLVRLGFSHDPLRLSLRMSVLLVRPCDTCSPAFLMKYSGLSEEWECLALHPLQSPEITA